LWIYDPTDNGWSKEIYANAEFALRGKFGGDWYTDEFFDYGSLGCWIRFGGWLGLWDQESTANPQAMVAGRFDPGSHSYKVVCDFGISVGVWIWDLTFTKISSLIPEAMQAVQFDFLFESYDDELAADFGSQGLWFFNPTGNGDYSGTWTQIAGADPGPMLAARTGSLDENLIVDFESLGVWIYSADIGFCTPPSSCFPIGWTKIAANNPDVLVRIKMENSDEWLVGDFGPAGLWIFYFDDTTSSYKWTKIAANSIPEF
jgi:hypothetical protein